MNTTIIFTIKNRRISSDTKSIDLIGDNMDYTAVFDLDEDMASERIKTARFIKDDVQEERILDDNNSCQIPPELLKKGYISVGVYTDEKSTTPCFLQINRSIRETDYPIKDPEPDVYRQLLDKIEKLKGLREIELRADEKSIQWRYVGEEEWKELISFSDISVSPEEIKQAVKEYLKDNPLEETDPTVPDWAKEPQKPTYTAEEVGALPTSKLPEAIDAALTQAKESGMFDGKDGKDGAPGEKGDPGETTYVENPYDDTQLKNDIGQLKEDLGNTNEQISYIQKDVRDIKRNFEFDVELSMVGYLASYPPDPTYIRWSDDTNGRSSDYIKCNDFAFLDVVLYGNEWVWQVSFYDKDKVFIPKISILGNDEIHKYSVDIPSEAVYLRVSSFGLDKVTSAKIMFSKENINKSIADLNERVSSLEVDTTSLFENTEFALFHTFGVIGDSLSVGHTVSEDGNLTEGRNIYYSWGQYLARRLGNNCLNFGRSGVTSKLWMSTSEQYCYPRLIDPNNLCQAYIIALGANDASMTLGSIADVNFSDMTQNADTEYGWYAKVINAVRTTAPNAPIFLFTLPYPRNSDDNIKAINKMIRVFGSDRTHFGKIFVVDLDANYNEYFKNGKLLNQIGNTGWHLTSLGYMYASHVNQKALSKVIADNYSDFQDVFTLPYGSNTILD